MLQDRVDKSIPVPLYYQLEKILREKIECGVWNTGDIIPTEMEMMGQYGISRSTVRQAIANLVNDGYLKREKSKGTTVTNTTSRKHVIGSLMSFTSEMNMKGISHHSKLLSQQVIKADRLLSTRMSVPEGSQVYYLKRVRYVNDRPFLVDEHYIPYYLVPEIELKYKENTSLYSLLQDVYSFNLHHGQIVFEPIHPTKNECDLLNITPTTSLILAERVVYSESNVVLDFFKAYIHGKVSIDVMNPASIG